MYFYIKIWESWAGVKKKKHGGGWLKVQNFMPSKGNTDKCEEWVIASNMSFFSIPV